MRLKLLKVNDCQCKRLSCSTRRCCVWCSVGLR